MFYFNLIFLFFLPWFSKKKLTHEKIKISVRFCWTFLPTPTFLLGLFETFKNKVLKNILWSWTSQKVSTVCCIPHSWHVTEFDPTFWRCFSLYILLMYSIDAFKLRRFIKLNSVDCFATWRAPPHRLFWNPLTSTWVLLHHAPPLSRFRILCSITQRAIYKRIFRCKSSHF